MSDPGTQAVRNALVSLYGSVAAVIRTDWFAAELMTSHFRRAFDDIGEMLILISLTTLERIHEVSPDELTDDSSNLARDMLTTAHGFSMASRATVHSAAWRLEAVRRGDAAAAAADITLSRTLGEDGELLRGSIALLTAIVTLHAIRTERPPGAVAVDLCMAASLAAVS